MVSYIHPRVGFNPQWAYMENITGTFQTATTGARVNFSPAGQVKKRTVSVSEYYENGQLVSKETVEEVEYETIQYYPNAPWQNPVISFKGDSNTSGLAQEVEQKIESYYSQG